MSLRTAVTPPAGCSVPGSQYAFSRSPFSRAYWIRTEWRTGHFSAIIFFVLS